MVWIWPLLPYQSEIAVCASYWCLSLFISTSVPSIIISHCFLFHPAKNPNYSITCTKPNLNYFTTNAYELDYIATLQISQIIIHINPFTVCALVSPLFFIFIIKPTSPYCIEGGGGNCVLMYWINNRQMEKNACNPRSIYLQWAAQIRSISPISTVQKIKNCSWHRRHMKSPLLSSFSYLYLPDISI